MTHEEFTEKLSPFFSGRDIANLYVWGMFEYIKQNPNEISTLTMTEAGEKARVLVCEQLYDCRDEIAEKFMENIKKRFIDFEITFANACALIEQFDEEW